MSREKSIRAIEKNGILLVYPIKNKKEPKSIWSELYPRSTMKWEWDENGDDRVGQLWLLREELSRSNRVVYAKWFQNRATFFSRSVFVNMLCFLGAPEGYVRLSQESQNILEALEMDSPLSTKQIKVQAELQGRWLEPTYNKAMKPLWRHLFIVAFGEFEDSSFPSLGVGATRNIFEDLWLEASEKDPALAEKELKAKLGEESLVWKYALKVKKLS